MCLVLYIPTYRWAEQTDSGTSSSARVRAFVLSRRVFNFQPDPTGRHDTTDPVALRAGNAAPARLLDGCRIPGPRFSRCGAAFHSVPSAVFIQLGARWDSRHVDMQSMTARCLFDCFDTCVMICSRVDELTSYHSSFYVIFSASRMKEAIKNDVSHCCGTGILNLYNRLSSCQDFSESSLSAISPGKCAFVTRSSRQSSPS